ncbi:MAG: hypothetical protein ABSA93_02095 [Streptosporangiaceae bacterium]|jgi:hypothetical protein
MVSVPAESLIRPAHSGVLRVRAHVPADAGAGDLTALRVLVIADVLTRAAELVKLQALPEWITTGDATAVEHAAAALNVRSPVAAAGTGSADVHVAAADALPGDTRGALVVPVARASLRSDEDHDALAIRLALLSYPSGQPVELTDRELTGAQATIGGWRRRVAGWAESSSKPIPEEFAAKILAAFAGLDTVAVLTTMDDLASDDGLPPGAKFEAFLFADRVLALELESGIGRLA